MDFKNASVKHKRFGNGTVLSLNGEALTIRFQQYGTRTFRFPDIFQTELKTDGSFSQSLWRKRCQSQLDDAQHPGQNGLPPRTGAALCTGPERVKNNKYSFSPDENVSFGFTAAAISYKIV